MDGKWGEKDLALTLAYTIYKDGICSCGQPVVIGHGESHKGWLVAKESVCSGCAAADKKRDEEGKAKSPTPGKKVYVVNERGSMPQPDRAPSQRPG